MSQEEPTWQGKPIIDYTHGLRNIVKDMKHIEEYEKTRKAMQELVYRSMAMAGPEPKPSDERVRVLEARLKVLEAENQHYRNILSE